MFFSNRSIYPLLYIGLVRQPTNKTEIKTKIFSLKKYEEDGEKHELFQEIGQNVYRSCQPSTNRRSQQATTTSSPTRCSSSGLR